MFERIYRFHYWRLAKEPLYMNPFKICPKCSFEWKARDEFLQDFSICLVGFQASFDKDDSGYFLFNHILEGNRCNTTLAVEVGDFLSLYKGHMFSEIKFKSPACEKHCNSVEDLAECRGECKNAVAREIMQNFSHCQ